MNGTGKPNSSLIAQTFLQQHKKAAYSTGEWVIRGAVEIYNFLLPEQKKTHTASLLLQMSWTHGGLEIIIAGYVVGKRSMWCTLMIQIQTCFGIQHMIQLNQ